MKKPSLAAILCLLLLSACSRSSEGPEPVDDRFRQGAEDVRRLLMMEDMSAVIEQIPPELVPGGQQVLDALRDAPIETAGAAELAENLEWEEPGNLHRVGDLLVRVAPYKSRVSGQTMRGCQIGLSRDDGQTWNFLSGSKGAVEGLQSVAPEIYQAIKDEIQEVELGS